MMHFNSRHKLISFLFATVLFASLAGCTSSQTDPSLDDEMLAETGGSEEVFDDSTGSSSDVAAGDDLGEEEFDFSDEGQAANDAGEEDLELDFDSQDATDLQAENEMQAEDDLAEELELDELKADDVVQTEEPAPIPAEPPVEELQLDDSFAQEPVLEDEPVAAATPAPVEEPLAVSKTTITDIRYLANQAGGTVVVEATGPLNHQSRFNQQTGQYVVEIQNATLPSQLKRPYLMKDFQGSFGSINAFQTPGENSVRVVVQLKPGFTDEPAVRAEGNTLVVVPPAASAAGFQAAGNTPPSGDAFGGAGGATNIDQPLASRSLEEFLMSNQKFYGKPISLQVRDAEIRDVVSFISEESGANIVMSDTVTGKISVKLRRVPWDQALVTVMRTKGLGYVRQGGVIRITTMKDLKEESENALDMLRAQQESAPVKVKVIPVNYANVESLVGQLREFLTKDGKVVADPRSNSVLITDKEDVLNKVSRLVTALDTQPNQVKIEGKIVEASENFASTVGVRWGFSGSPVTLSPTGGAFGTPLDLTPSLAIGDVTNVTANRMGFQVGTLDFLGNLSAALNLAERDQTAKIISSPSIVAMNREQAEIGQQGEVISVVSIRNAQSGDLTTTENRIKLNLRLAVTPQITTDGSVIMDMDVIREFAGPVSNQITESRPVNTRTAKTRVLVRDGETAVIGGIYQADDNAGEDGVPILKDIPVLGWLFKSKFKSREKNELLIFLTPQILANQPKTNSSAAL